MWLCALASAATLAYVVYWVGQPADIVELSLFVWPLSPYGLIAALACRARQSRFWSRAFLVSCLAGALTAAVRYFGFWLSAAADPGYSTIIVRIGFTRVPLEQFGVWFLVVLAAWFYSLARRR